MSLTREHDHEPIPGLPELLPEGEYVRWQGAPNTRDLAIAGFHVRKLAIYFGLLLAARVAVQTGSGAPLADTLASTAVLTVMAGLALGFLVLYAWLSARSTRYTITNRRLVIRCGVTLPMTVNLPFKLLTAADLRVRSSGYGDLPVTLAPEHRPSWIVLWPHVRPWHLGRVQPMLRSVPDAEAVGAQLTAALKEYGAEAQRPVTTPRIQREPVGLPSGLTSGV